MLGGFRRAVLGVIIIVIIALALVPASLFLARISEAQTSRSPTFVMFYSPLPGSSVGVGGRFYLVVINVITTDPRITVYPEISINPSIRINATTLVTFTTNYTAIGPVDGVSIGAGAPVFGLGKNEAFPGLVVIFNNTPAGLGGPGRNLANLFQFTGFQDRLDIGGRTLYRSIQTVWMVGAPLWCGWTKALAAVVSNNSAPDIVPDSNGDGVIDEKDLEALGLASNIASVVFYVKCS